MAEPARCALFVDHENIWLSLKQAYGLAVAGEEFCEDLALQLKECCQARGELEYWAAVADWTKGEFGTHAKAYNRYAYEVILNFTGPNNADLKIQGAIMDLMNRRPEIDTYIIATGDKGFQPTLQRIVHSGKHAVIWGVRGATNQTLQTFASEFEHLDKLLGDLLRDAMRQGSVRGAGTSRAGTGPMRTAAPRASNGAQSEDLAPGRRAPSDAPGAAPHRPRAPLPLLEARDRSGSLSNLDALAVYADYYMRANHFAFFTFAKFLDFLNQRNLVGLSDEEREMWLKSAVNTEIFASEEVRLTDHHTGEGKTIRRFRLADDSPRVAEARAVIEHVLKFLADTLTGPFNPSFSKLRDQLQAVLPAMSLDRVHNWLSWLKETNVLLTKEVPHKRDPAIKVKLVRLNPDHFLVKHLAAGPYAGPEELLVCVVDSHLIEHGHAWMAASKLLERIADKLSADGRPPAEARKEAKEILDAAKADKLVRVAKPTSLAPEPEEGAGDEEGGYFPSMDLSLPTAAPPASQVYLERDHSRVTEIVERRNAMIRLMHEGLRGRAWIARSTYQREIGALFGEDRSEVTDPGRAAADAGERAVPAAGDRTGPGPTPEGPTPEGATPEGPTPEGPVETAAGHGPDPEAVVVSAAGDRAPSDAGDRPASDAGDRAGSAAGDRAASDAGDQAASAAGDRAGSAAGDRPGAEPGAAPHELVHFWINLLTYLRIFLPRQVPNPRGGTTNALMLNPSSRVAAEALADLLPQPTDAADARPDEALSG